MFIFLFFFERKQLEFKNDLFTSFLYEKCTRAAVFRLNGGDSSTAIFPLKNRLAAVKPLLARKRPCEPPILPDLYKQL